MNSLKTFSVLIGSVMLLVLFGCQTGQRNKSEPVSVFVKPIQGVMAQPDRTLGSDVRKKIEYNASVELLHETREPGSYFGTVKIRWQEKEYWISNSAYSPSRDPQFFRIVTKSGLNLRVEPNLRGKIQIVMPFLASGKVIAVHPKAENIQGRTGYWLQVSYKSLNGWLFSGFVMTGESLERLEIQDMPVGLAVAEAAPISDSDIEKNLGKIGDLEGVDFFHFNRPADDCSSSSSLKRLGIYYQENGKPKRSIGGDIETPVRTNVQGSNFLVTFHQHCICCCPNGSHILYLKQNATIRPYYINLGRFEGSCNSQMGPNYDTDTRITGDKTKIMTFVRAPICEGLFAPAGEGHREVDVTNVEYNRGRFTVFDLATGKVQNFDTLKIPAEFAEIWSKSFTLAGF